MRPVQPYFALSAGTYFKRSVQRNGIAHFYEYTCEHADHDQVLAVPDASIDLIFDIGDGNVQARAVGTVLNGTPVENARDHQYFGVRFQPGVKPGFLHGSFSDYVGESIELSVCSRVPYLTEMAADCSTFQERAALLTNVVLKSLFAQESEIRHTMTKDNLVEAVKKEILLTSGSIRISELAEYTGYSSRYIDRIFKEYTGISPKTFCRITRFQSTLDRLDHDTVTSLSDLAADCGYYDQPQFIRDFRRCMDTTPKTYRQAIVENDYAGKFVMV